MRGEVGRMGRRDSALPHLKLRRRQRRHIAPATSCLAMAEALFL
ncbi:Hypothetical protein CAP_1341 [Chondromyces apiculatus DSM 436]|uniref:Uncharacterized protein n=1 Tax=Chondromyces apiculatus DSM 436 TaxID=1192034 RepID=A0A017ST45_9BACT|nr:Hypothetical protein CAP_1341 [Chondromyces apiculatus DSM 436]